jgi:hypothetical protein
LITSSLEQINILNYQLARSKVIGALLYHLLPGLLAVVVFASDLDCQYFILYYQRITKCSEKGSSCEPVKISARQGGRVAGLIKCESMGMRLYCLKREKQLEMIHPIGHSIAKSEAKKMATRNSW